MPQGAKRADLTGAFEKKGQSGGIGELSASKGSRTALVATPTAAEGSKVVPGWDIRAVPGVPKDITACRGSCELPRAAKQTLTDLADLWLSPMVPGPLHVGGALGAGSARGRGAADLASGGDIAAVQWGNACAHSSSARPTPSALFLDDRGRLERLWELRLCVEQLRDTLESFESDGEREALYTAEETLDATESILRRTVELGVVPSAGESLASRLSARAGVLSRTGIDPMDGGDVLRAIGSLSMQRGALTHCLLTSRLNISGLLEAVLGESTDWRSSPSEADLRLWRRWDVSYARLARRAGGAWDFDLCDVGCCSGAEGPGPASRSAEGVVASRPQCAPACCLTGF